MPTSPLKGEVILRKYRGLPMTVDSTLVIVHADKEVRASLVKTLQPLWEGKVIDAPENSGTNDAQTLYLSLTPSPSPPRLRDVVWQLEQRAKAQRWPKEIRIGEARLETTTRLFHYEAKTQELTEKEVGLLVYLHHKKMPATRQDVLRDVWRYADDAETHTVETHIHRLRQKIEDDPENPVFVLTTKDGYTLG